MNDLKITAAGNFPLNNKHSLSKSIVYVTGTLGGAVVNITGFGGILTDGAALASPSQTEIRHGTDSPINLNVVGGSPDLVVRCVGLH